MLNILYQSIQCMPTSLPAGRLAGKLAGLGCGRKAVYLRLFAFKIKIFRSFHLLFPTKHPSIHQTRPPSKLSSQPSYDCQLASWREGGGVRGGVPVQNILYKDIRLKDLRFKILGCQLAWVRNNASWHKVKIILAPAGREPAGGGLIIRGGKYRSLGIFGSLRHPCRDGCIITGQILI